MLTIVRQFYAMASDSAVHLCGETAEYLEPVAAAAESEVRARTGRGPVPRHRHHRIPECGWQTPCVPAVRCPRDQGGRSRRRHFKGQPRNRPEAAQRRSGQSTRRSQCAADLPDRRGNSRSNRSQPSLRPTNRLKGRQKSSDDRKARVRSQPLLGRALRSTTRPGSFSLLQIRHIIMEEERAYLQIALE
jgi:hypothetical protein